MWCNVCYSIVTSLCFPRTFKIKLCLCAVAHFQFPYSNCRSNFHSHNKKYSQVQIASSTLCYCQMPCTVSSVPHNIYEDAKGGTWLYYLINTKLKLHSSPLRLPCKGKAEFMVAFIRFGWILKFQFYEFFLLKIRWIFSSKIVAATLWKTCWNLICTLNLHSSCELPFWVLKSNNLRKNSLFCCSTST